MKIAMLILIAAVAAQAQTASLEGVLHGKEFPLTLKLKDLDASWRRLTAHTGTEALNPATMYRAMYGGGTGAGVYFTKGQTTTVAGETYLVAYRIVVKPLEMAQLNALMRGGGPPPEPEKPTATSPLALALLNLRMAGSFTDIRAFDLEVELGGETEDKAGDGSGETSVKNLRQIGVALLSYLGERRVLPVLTDAKVAREELVLYVRNQEVFTQPGTQKPYLPNPALSGKKPSDFEKPEKTVVFYEAAPAGDGTRGVLYLDGRAERIAEQQWKKLKELSQLP
jgi:hypothetical protein